MAIDVDLEPLFDATVTIAKRSCTHTDGYPKPGYGTAKSYYAHIERSADLRRMEGGREIVSKRKVFLYSSTGWTAATIPTPADRMTLPNTHGPDVTPQIMLSQIVSDEFGIHHIVLWC